MQFYDCILCVRQLVSEEAMSIYNRENNFFLDAWEETLVKENMWENHLSDKRKLVGYGITMYVKQI